MSLKGMPCPWYLPSGVAAAALLIMSQLANAEPVLLPERHIPDVMVIDAGGVVELLRQNRRLTLIDARIPFDRQRGYIEGSVGLSDVDTDCNALEKVSPDRDRPVIFYCNGPKCVRSERSIRIARQCKYKQIYWFVGGFEEWVAKRYPYRIGD